MTDLRTLDDRSVAALEEERDFLLASLDDLEREHEAGDVDDADYAALRADYTKRTAVVLRSLESKQVRVAEPRSSNRWSRIGWVGALVVFGVLAGVLVARSSGSRGAGEVTGDVTASTRTLLFEAGQAGAVGDWDTAIDRYSAVLDIEPSNEEAWTYRGWMRRNAGDDEGALDDLDEAVLIDPAFPDARVFRASVLLTSGDVDGAAADLAAFDASDPPAEMLDLVEGMGLRAGVVYGVVLSDDAPPLAESGFSIDEVADAGVSFALVGELVNAAQLLDLVVADDPDNVVALTYRGFIRAVASADDDALADDAEALLDRALEIDPAYPDALAIRGVFRLSIRDDASGAADDAARYEATGDQTPHLRDYLANSGLIG